MHSDVQSRAASPLSSRLLLPLICLAMLSALPGRLWAAGTQAGTLIENTARIDFVVAGSAESIDSNTVSLAVDERIDIQATALTPQVPVAPAEEDRALLVRVTNVGNGSEALSLGFNSSIPGDDFDPLPGVPAIFFDTDASGDFSLGDVAYVPGSNDPVLAADAFIDVLLLNDMPANVINGQVGRSELVVSAQTGTGAPGDAFPGQGDGGGDAVLGSSGGTSTVQSEYVVADVQINITKAVQVNDPLGGNEPVPGATLTYTVTIAVANGGVATNSVFEDPIPSNTRYVPSTIALNGSGLTDTVADDAGEFDSANVPTVVVRLGDLTQADGVQTVSFDVVIE